MPLWTTLLTQVGGIAVSKLCNLLFGGGGNSEEQLQQNLRRFLDNLSTEFAVKVEEAIKSAFFENQFDNIKRDILLANETLVRFKATVSAEMLLGDERVLSEAKHDIDQAYALLQTQTTRILSASANPPIDPPTRIVSYLNVTEIAILALQSLVAVDIYISSEYATFHPNYTERFIQRLEGYIALLNSLYEVFERHQPLRVIAKEKYLYWPQAFDEHYERFKDVSPSLDWIKSNSTYWKYLIDGREEVGVSGAPMPDNYYSYTVHYKYLDINASVSAQQARHENTVVKDIFAAGLKNRAVARVRPKVEEAISIWRETIEGIKNYEKYRFLVETVENNIPLNDNQRENRIREYFPQLNKNDKNKLFCRSIRLQRVYLATIFRDLGADINAEDEDSVQNNDFLFIDSVRTGEVELIKIFLIPKFNFDKFYGRQDPTELAQKLGFNEMASLIEQEKFNQLLSLYSRENSDKLHPKFQKLKWNMIDSTIPDRQSGESLLDKANRINDQWLVSVINKFTDENKFLAAASQGDIARIQTLMNQGVNINYSEAETGDTALHKATFIQERHLRALTFDCLIQAGADLFLKNNREYLAAELNGGREYLYPLLFPKLIELISNGMLPEKFKCLSSKAVQDYRELISNNTLLHLAVGSTLSEDEKIRFIDYIYYLAPLLMGNLAKEIIFYKNNNGYTAKQIAQNFNQQRVVEKIESREELYLRSIISVVSVNEMKIFIERGGNINRFLNDYTNAAHMLVNYFTLFGKANQSIEMLRLLVNNGIDLTCKDRSGKTITDKIRLKLKGWTSFFNKESAPYFQALNIIEENLKTSLSLRPS